MSCLHVVVDRVDGKEPERRQLLAVFAMRGRLEPRETIGVHRRAMGKEMTDAVKNGATARARTLRRLQELIAALDRRVPRVDGAGERSIATAAAALRADAVRRIEELEG